MTETTPAEVTFRYEMGYMPAEVQQRLPAVASVEHDAARTQFDHVEDGRRWSLWLIDPRKRAIASISLPTVDVEIVFVGYTKPEIDSILARFHAHFRRGGG